MQSRPTRLWMTLATVGWVLLHQLALQKMPHIYAENPQVRFQLSRARPLEFLGISLAPSFSLTPQRSLNQDDSFIALLFGSSCSHTPIPSALPHTSLPKRS